MVEFLKLYSEMAYLIHYRAKTHVRSFQIIASYRVRKGVRLR